MKIKKHQEGKAVTRSVSLPEEIAAAADERAASQHRNFSNYIKTLVAEDVAKAEVVS